MRPSRRGAGAPRSAARPRRRRTRCRRSRRSRGPRDARPRLRQLLEQAEGEQIVGAERRRRAACCAGSPASRCPACRPAATRQGPAVADQVDSVAPGGAIGAVVAPSRRSRDLADRRRVRRRSAIRSMARSTRCVNGEAGRRARRRRRRSRVVCGAASRSTRTTGVPRARGAAAPELCAGSTGRDQDALDPLLLELRSRYSALAPRIAVAVAQDQRRGSRVLGDASSMPRATSVKNGLPASSIT